MTTPAPLDPLALTQALIRCPSVTPADAGALSVLEAALTPLGFDCHRLPFALNDSPRVENLYARFGKSGRNFCFAGHTDVVPHGNKDHWRVDPYDAAVIDGELIGRGAADMKGAIGAFAAAASRFLAKRKSRLDGSISLLITGDEEGPSVNGTKPVLGWLKERGETLDACIVGEPTNPERLGQMIKIGRRGSMSGWLTVKGVQGHSAYPHLADNPVHRLVGILNRLIAEPLDKGSEHFQPSTLQIVSVDVGNPATNVIPAEARAVFNIRFNDRHSSASIEHWLRAVCTGSGANYELRIHVSGESFLTPPGPLSDLIARAVARETGLTPELSTTGGTSDARFIKDFCPVAEFGLAGSTMHKVDERVPVQDLETLTRIYEGVLEGYFPAP
nr:succinyl-diaminopimelate desuccinylase [Hypericibacter terrae]